MKKLLILILIVVSSCSFKYGTLKEGQTVRQLLAEKSIVELQTMKREIAEKNKRMRQVEYQSLMVDLDMLIKNYKYKGVK